MSIASGVLETDGTILRCLTDAEPRFAGIIEAAGPIRMETGGDAFEALAGAIIAQQLSGKAAETIRDRVTAMMGGRVTADGVLAAPDADFRATGVSGQKTRYLKCLAEAMNGGRIRPEEFGEMEDEAVIGRLVSVKGIGRWTAEMFLIFSLGRPDVFSPGDGGLQRAVMKLYGLQEIPAREELVRIGERWRPYRTFASLYLWKSLSVRTPDF